MMPLKLRSKLRRMPKLDWLQVEVSSGCNASCAYCPVGTYRENYQNRLLSMETFSRLTDAFRKVRMLYLQGWGEPLLNPDFFEMVRLAKSADLRVGITTNGMLLTRKIADQLVQLGLDVVAFSLVGVNEWNDAVRRGTRLEQVLGAIQILNQAKKHAGVAQPAVHIAYMILRSGLQELDRLPGLLTELRIAQVVLSTLDFVTAPEFIEETLNFTKLEEYQALRARMDILASRGAKSNLEIHYRLVAPKELFASEEDMAGMDSAGLSAVITPPRPTCTENIQRAAFISANGDVSPCVYLNVPVEQVTYFAQGREKPYQRLTFGNINEESLDEIWFSRDYQAFRRAHLEHRLPDMCLDCVKPYSI